MSDAEKSEFDFIMSSPDKLGEHLGEWIVVVGEEIVASGENLMEIYQKAKEKYPDSTPLVMKIPKETIMAF